MSTKDITAKVRQLKRLQAKADELQAEITAIQDELKAELKAQNTEELLAGEYKIRFTTVTSNRFDSKAFKALYSDLYKQFTKQTSSRRFTIA